VRQVSHIGRGRALIVRLSGNSQNIFSILFTVVMHAVFSFDFLIGNRFCSETCDLRLLCIIFLEIDSCMSNPCTNGGACKKTLKGYRCRCPAGYSGKNCQTAGKAVFFIHAFVYTPHCFSLCRVVEFATLLTGRLCRSPG